MSLRREEAVRYSFQAEALALHKSMSSSSVLSGWMPEYVSTGAGVF